MQNMQSEFFPETSLELALADYHAIVIVEKKPPSEVSKNALFSPKKLYGGCTIGVFKKKGFTAINRKPLISLVGVGGIEPPTN